MLTQLTMYNHSLFAKGAGMNKIGATRGFTLIELLVVVAIIGILAAIAIPQFATYRQKGYDAQATSDLRNAATAEEAYYASHQTYWDGTCTSGSCTLPGLSVSANTTVVMTAGADSFTGTATNSGGTMTFSYDSANGGMQ